jgi:probable phosphomutase (TIGR03848 family)
LSAATTVLLIRHATTAKVGKALTGWLSGVSLDENGREQALRLAERLSGFPVAAIYSSPLERAVETAQPLARARSLEIVPCPDFGEINFGTWQGKLLEEIEDDVLWQRFNSYRSMARAPGGELMLETQTRMIRGLEQVCARHPGETVAIFSHADAIKSAVMHILGIPLDFHFRLEILPASVSVLELYSEVARVKCLNISADLG